ncbi:glycosyltransferase family 4 protein [Phenylobacterium terrae]|uniref:glycosyltransferase family 4 protein n=1 Tax=Phenylobacterium terrae TaxID=2665495 RepID=UPI003671DA47
MKRTPGIRLLMTADAVGGVWTYALDLARGLAPMGVRTSLVVLGPEPKPDQRLEAEAVPGLELIETGLPLDWTAPELADIREAGAVIRGLARGVSADLIHLNSPSLAYDGGFCAPVIGACHSCLATWWSEVRDGPMPQDFRWRSSALWQGLINCDITVAPTAAFAEATARAYEVPRPFVVHNGRLAPAFAPAPRERMVFTAGRLWDDGKNIGLLDAAAARIDAPVYAAGPLESPTGERRSLAHARPLGRLATEEVGRWMTRAGVFASGALYEPFGLTVLEAAQAGCPLVLSDIPTFRELWDGAALFVPADDPDAMAAALQRLLDDRDEAARLARAARSRAGRYSVQAMAEGVRDVYRLVAPQLRVSRQEAAA